MRILHVITSMLMGGAEHIVVQLTEAMRREGLVVDVAVFNGEDTPFMRQLEETGCVIYKLGRGYYNLSYIPKLRHIMGTYDIVHTHNSSPQLFASIAALGMDIILVTTEHNTTNRKRNNRFMYYVDKWMYGKYKAIVTISKQAEINLRRYLNMHGEERPSQKIITILNGVDVKGIRQAQPYVDGEIKDIDGRNIPVTSTFNLIQVAAFRPQKAQTILMDALEYLDERVNLWLVGDGELRQALTHHANSLRSRSRIFFLGNRNDVPRLLRTADLVCMSTHYEGLSLSNVEGMSAGKPFVASDVDGIHEVTEGAGVLVAEGDAKALADGISTLYYNDNYYQSVAEKCYRRALKYDIQQMVNGYRQLYMSICK